MVFSLFILVDSFDSEFGRHPCAVRRGPAVKSSNDPRESQLLPTLNGKEHAAPDVIC
jgi:hypothetical protein